MAGRGWSKTTFSQDQLQALGVASNDMPPVVLEPPPTYPSLSTKPQPFEENEVVTYALKKNLEISNERHKPQYRQPNTVKYHYMIHNASNYDYRNIKNDFAWSNLPEELGPGQIKRNKKIRKSKQQIPDENIVERLTDLEKKEQLDSAVEVGNKRRNSEELGEEEAEEENQTHTDDEFDDDNDYGNSYFDNGEAYDDNADEPLDDGPIY